MSIPASIQRCESCGRVSTELDASPVCACGGLREVKHSVTHSADELKHRFAVRAIVGRGDAASGVWRYRELVLPGATRQEIVSYPEGNTPLVQRRRVAEWTGVEDLLLKHEGLNPTGSFKDRGMTVAVTQARRVGAAAVACASTGNTSASLAAYAAQGGLRALVLIPAGQVAMGKLAQTLAYGATTLAVRSDFDRCLALLREAAARLGVYLVNSVNPFRIEGQKTIVFELLQQLDWEAPDWIVLPAGNLGNTSAFGKALREAHELGLIARLPRIAAVQASGAAPFAQAFAQGFASRREVKAETVATAINIGAPASWDRAVRAIRETEGVVCAVSDDAILEAKAVVDGAGVGCEPASAASVAGARQLVRDGVIRRGERVVAVLTGNVLKDPEILLRRGAPRGPIEIDADLASVERMLSADGR